MNKFSFARSAVLGGAADLGGVRQPAKCSLRFAALIVLMLAVTLPAAHAQILTALHQFDSLTDGAFPEGGVIRDAAGNLYGTTSSGFELDGGTVFKIDTTGKESILFTFNDSAVTGIFPTGIAGLLVSGSE